MSVIEKHIHDHFARQAQNAPAGQATSSGTRLNMGELSSPQVPQVLGPPFAKVNSVVSGSPADSAGLKAGDEIRIFGYVNQSNHDSLKRVGECVQGNVGVSSLCSSVRLLPFFTEVGNNSAMSMSKFRGSPTTHNKDRSCN